MERLPLRKMLPLERSLAVEADCSRERRLCYRFFYSLLLLSLYAQVIILSFHKLLSISVVPLSAVGAGVVAAWRSVVW